MCDIFILFHIHFFQSQSGGISRSFLNLTINEDEEQDHFDMYSTRSSRPPTVIKRSSTGQLSKPRSMIDLRADDPPYKIAMQTATEAHVSKIVIPSPPKNQMNALRRLDELSSAGSKV